jgi:hypothetical protein
MGANKRISISRRFRGFFDLFEMGNEISMSTRSQKGTNKTRLILFEDPPLPFSCSSRVAIRPLLSALELTCSSHLN